MPAECGVRLENERYTRPKILMVMKMTRRPSEDSRKPMTAPERKAAWSKALSKHRKNYSCAQIDFPEPLAASTAD